MCNLSCNFKFQFSKITGLTSNFISFYLVGQIFMFVTIVLCGSVTEIVELTLNMIYVVSLCHVTCHVFGHVTCRLGRA